MTKMEARVPRIAESGASSRSLFLRSYPRKLPFLPFYGSPRRLFFRPFSFYSIKCSLHIEPTSMRDDTEQEDAKTAVFLEDVSSGEPVGFQQPTGYTESSRGDLGEGYQPLGSEDVERDGINIELTGAKSFVNTNPLAVQKEFHPARS